MSDTCEPKTRVTIGITARIQNAAHAEAKRLGITFSEAMRRMADDWVDRQIASQPKTIEKIVVLDNGILRPTR